MDGPGAIGRQVGQPTLGHEAVEQQGRAVAQQVGAVDQHHARAARACETHALGAQPDLLLQLSRHRLGRASGIDEDVIGTGQAPALGERQDLQPAEIQGNHSGHGRPRR